MSDKRKPYPEIIYVGKDQDGETLIQRLVLQDGMTEYVLKSVSDNTNRLLCRELDEAQKVVEARDERIAELEDNRTNHDVRCNQYHREAEEREQYLCGRIKALEEQAAIDKDFIRQYQAQVEALQAESENHWRQMRELPKLGEAVFLRRRQIGPRWSHRAVYWAPRFATEYDNWMYPPGPEAQPQEQANDN